MPEPSQHEITIAEEYERLFTYEAFDRLVDMALDGQITIEEAVRQYRADMEDSGNGGH